MSINAIRENKFFAKISESTVFYSLCKKRSTTFLVGCHCICILTITWKLLMKYATVLIFIANLSMQVLFYINVTGAGRDSIELCHSKIL